MDSSPDLTVGRAVDWKFAGVVGARLARSAPPVSDYTRRQAIDDLAEAAVAAEAPVREITRLFTDEPVPSARIVDRRDWIRAADLTMTVGLDSAAGTINGHNATGHIVRFRARAVTDLGRSYERTASIFVAPHDPMIESRSLRATPR